MTIAVASFLIWPIVGNAEEVTPALTKRSKNIERVVETLNTALKENRQIREELLATGAGLDQVKVQNNILVNQIRQLQQEAEQIKRDRKNEASEYDRLVAELKEEKRKLSEERKQIKAIENASAEKVIAIKKENDQLLKVLDHAILESERDEYKKLLDEAQSASERAVQELAQVKTENQRLRYDVGNQYYTIGNIFFEKRQYDEAIKRYKKAVEIDKSDSWSHHNLGIIYDYYLQDHERALYHYGQYLKLKPIKEVTDEIRERVLQLELQKLMVPDPPLLQEYLTYQKELTLNK